jgi:hypothetical protein
LLLTDGLVQRQNNHLPSQAGDKDGWPIFVIADLDRNDCARRQRIDFFFEKARSLFDLIEALHDLPSCIENRGVIAFARDRRPPRE